MLGFAHQLQTGLSIAQDIFVINLQPCTHDMGVRKGGSMGSNDPPPSPKRGHLHHWFFSNRVLVFYINYAKYDCVYAVPLSRKIGDPMKSGTPVPNFPENWGPRPQFFSKLGTPPSLYFWKIGDPFVKLGTPCQHHSYALTSLMYVSVSQSH